MSLKRCFFALSQDSSYPNSKHVAFKTITTIDGGLLKDLMIPNYILSIELTKDLASFNNGIMASYYF